MNRPASSPSVWHAGERALQSRLGIDDRMAEFGSRVIRDHMPDQHRGFFGQLPFVVVGSLDAHAQPWASVLAAPAGFMHSPDPRRLRIDARPAAGDPLAAALHPGAAVGLLGIEPHTRRRNRMNGRVEAVDASGFSVAVTQSFGNCPKYIQAREARFEPAGGEAVVPAPAPVPTRALDAAARRIVEAADTFFIASAHPDAAASGVASKGVDMSHRGGPPGFVRIGPGGTLQVPDYAGNRFFNTLGNVELHPYAGLLFVDFEHGDLLQLAVRARVVWGGAAVDAVPGAERLLQMEVLAVRHAPSALPLRWGPASRSPYLPH